MDHTRHQIVERTSVTDLPSSLCAMQVYPSWDTFEFDQGQVNKNQPITMLVLLTESLDI